MFHITTTARFRAEKKWVFQVLLGELLDLKYSIGFQEDRADPNGAVTRLLLPNGKVLAIEDHFFAQHRENEYLRSENIPEAAPTFPNPFDATAQLTAIFGRSAFSFDENGACCGLDLFASAFFMLSRWEEYVRPERDSHGRFPASAALAFRSGFLQRPVVHEYAELIRCLCAKLGTVIPPPKRAYTLLPIHDVDHPQLWRTPADRLRTLAGSLFGRRDPAETRWWLSGPVWRKKDPYDTFDYLMGVSEKQGCRSQFNFMGQRKPGSDCYYPLHTPFIRDLMEKIAKRGHVIGFHASYESFEQPDLLAPERESIRSMAADSHRPTPSVHSGCQHYLRFAAPYTWQHWENQQMQTDSTLGYSEIEGFRCGICVSYPVFNFLTRQPLHLRERPLLAMDVTLALYRRYTPDQAIEALHRIEVEVRKHRGEFVLLWHNSSLNTYLWAGWEAVYESVFDRI